MKINTENTFQLGVVIVTENADLFRQAQAVAVDAGEDEALQFDDSRVALVDTDECWDLRREEDLGDIMEIVRAARRTSSGSSLYVIYDGTQEDLLNARVVMTVL